MKKFVSVVLVLVVLILLAGVVLSSGRQPQPFPAASQSEAWMQPGALPVEREAVTFVDDSRPTQANGEFGGAPSRRLEGMLWRPADSSSGPYPLIVYSHGFMSTWEGGAYLSEHMASLGYVVVAVNYPLTNFAAPGGPNVQDVVHQPADISFMIDTLLRQSATTGHALADMIDASRIGVMGISLGGLTSTLAAFHPEMGDPRIGAALSIAGPTAIFMPAFFAHTRVPFMMLAGDIDAVVPYGTNAAPIPDKVPGSQLVTVVAGSHSGFAGPAAPFRWINNPDSIGCYMVLNNISESVLEEPWYDLIGSPEQGIDQTVENELCLVEPLPPALNVLRQHMIATVVVSSFFESLFGRDAGQRERARNFLSSTLSAEVPEVRYRASGEPIALSY